MIRLFSSPSKLFLLVLVFFCFICPIGMYGAVSIPSVAGPLKVTEDSYPFGAAAKTVVPQDLSKFGYVEEEFLVSGKANVYDFDSAGKVVVKTPDAPYTTRILVRRPAARNKFSGNVVVELLNPSALHDLDLQWTFCRERDTGKAARAIEARAFAPICVHPVAHDQSRRPPIRLVRSEEHRGALGARANRGPI